MAEHIAGTDCPLQVRASYGRQHAYSDDRGLGAQPDLSSQGIRYYNGGGELISIPSAPFIFLAVTYESLAKLATPGGDGRATFARAASEPPKSPITADISTSRFLSIL